MKQAELQAMKIEQEREAAERIRRENAVALLAEKERRYAFCEVHSGQKMQSCPCCEAVHQADLREAAEQRLQEAQAQIIKIQTEADSTIKVYDERLRQREAELDELREHCVSEHECTFCKLPDKRCPKCVEEGKKSILYGGDSGISTCMGISHYYDEEGREHHHDPNSFTRHYHCSNGHSFGETTYHQCPNCDFGKAKVQK